MSMRLALGESPRRVSMVLAPLAIALALWPALAPAATPVAWSGLEPGFNLPQALGAGLHLACAAVLALIAYAHRGDRRRGHWTGLALLFGYFCLEELTRVHERVGEACRALSGWDGWLNLPWLMPYAVVGVALLVAYARFVNELPAATRRAFLLAAGLFLAGAIGFELVGAAMVVRAGALTPEVLALSRLEEGLELGGTALFLAASWRYAALIEKGVKSVSVSK